MGVCVDAMMYVGKYVDDPEAYLIQIGLLKEGQLTEDYDSDLGAMHDFGFPLQVQLVSYYSHQGAYVGFEVSPADYKQFDELIEKFGEITGDSAEVCQFEHWW